VPCAQDSDKEMPLWGSWGWRSWAPHPVRSKEKEPQAYLTKGETRADGVIPPTPMRGIRGATKPLTTELPRLSSPICDR
jgi:hypothetical protein